MSAPPQCDAATLVVSPRLRVILERAAVRPRPSVRNISDAVSMAENALGVKTETVRRMAIRAAVAADAARRRADHAGDEPAVHTTVAARTARSCDLERPPVGGAHPLVVAPTTVPVTAPSQTVGGGSVPFQSSRDIESALAAREAQRLLACIPDAMLMHGRYGAVPTAVRRANLVSTISQYDPGTVSKGRTAVQKWLEFCRRHCLAEYGAPFSADVCVWFLREEDERARQPSATARVSSRTGGTVRHARACALRWLAAVGCVPFAAHDLQVRRSAPPDASKEPGMTSMWEVAVVRHFLIIAVRYYGPRELVSRVYAAAAYVMCIASLRQLDAVRSAAPQRVMVDGVPALHGVALYTKGHNTRARQRPMPWWIPTVSIEPSISDQQVADALEAVFSWIPPGAPSMFLELVDAEGKPCGLHEAVSFGASPARPDRLAASLAYLMTWAPLSYPAATAKDIAAGKHGPRHTLPEIARVMGMPAEARDELGRWKGSGGRLQRHANRYSREGERLLQVLLRSRLVRRIRQVVETSYNTSPFVSIPLSAFAAAGDAALGDERDAFDATQQRCLLLLQ